VDHIKPGKEVLPFSLALAKAHAKKGKNKAVYRKVKEGIFQHALEVFKDKSFDAVKAPKEPKEKAKM
jgi:hypothetical protein